MKPHELFRSLSSEETAAIVLAACQDDGVPDRLAGAVLSLQNISLARFGRLPEETRKTYVRRTLRDRRASELGLFVLSAALVRRKKELIEAFLEAAGLPHDGAQVSSEGEIPEPPEATVNAAVDALLARFPARDAAIYLHAFAAQPDVGWQSLASRLAADGRLQLEDRSAF
jgi:hypothetical protein